MPSVSFCITRSVSWATECHGVLVVCFDSLIPLAESNRNLGKRIHALVIEFIVHSYGNPGTVSGFSQTTVLNANCNKGKALVT